MSFRPTQASLGLELPRIRVRVISRGGPRSAGDVVMLDITRSDEATVNSLVSDPGSVLVNVVSPAAQQLPYGIFMVMETNTEDDGRGYAVVSGFVHAYLIRSSGDILPGDRLVVTEDGNLSPDGSTASKIVGVFIPESGSPLVSPTTRVLGRVMFNGLNGFGAFAQ